MTTVTAVDADLPRLRLLDEQIRSDIPGAAGWVWTAEEFVEETFGPQFGPAFGCFGVREDWRGSRVAALLARDVHDTLVGRGEHTVSASVDETNRRVLGVVRHLGAEVVGRELEHLHPG